MAVWGWICSLAALLSLIFTGTHSHRGEIETYHVSAGHLFLLKCRIAAAAAAHSNVTWSKVGRHNQSLPDGVEVRDGLLWFLPLQSSHNGTYICEERTDGRVSSMELGVSVSSEECPDPARTKSITQGVSDRLPCQQTEIFKLNMARSIRWQKACQPVERKGDLQPISVDVKGSMRLPMASESDAGIYTCLVDVSLDGKNYTSAHSIRLIIDNKMEERVSVVPQIVCPQQNVFVAEGARQELQCLAYIGFSEDNETLIYWTIDEKDAEEYELHQSRKNQKERGKWFIRSTLSISKVPRKFLNVPIHCHVENTVGADKCLVRLLEADHSPLYISVALCLAAPLTLLALAAAFLFCKVDLVLAYRKLTRHFSKQALDGKLYDAYVSVLHPDTLSSAESFALQILPEKLERQHGYSLYIRERDDCPGEAMHDMIASAVQRCRRLIIILTAEAKSSTNKMEEDCPSHNDHNQLFYEHIIGLHDALMQNEPQVILVEIDGPVDYSHLPESLRFIKRKQGALKWKTSSLSTHKLNSNRHFWKHLRYHMPSVPAGTRQTVV
ncbi:interleukin-18 receptor 1 [Scomber japonicus]|uniref:interleukin-18 receptor 1 n=1 Tax=Scomber japonicus TaxID=13676 RepID=UPI00230541C7|nr:interleukin-18 receptor 1 [Scomber japonicus]